MNSIIYLNAFMYLKRAFSLSPFLNTKVPLSLIFDATLNASSVDSWLKFELSSSGILHIYPPIVS